MHEQLTSCSQELPQPHQHFNELCSNVGELLQSPLSRVEPLSNGPDLVGQLPLRRGDAFVKAAEVTAQRAHGHVHALGQLYKIDCKYSKHKPFLFLYALTICQLTISCSLLNEIGRPLSADTSLVKANKASWVDMHAMPMSPLTLYAMKASVKKEMKSMLCLIGFSNNE